MKLSFSKCLLLAIAIGSTTSLASHETTVKSKISNNKKETTPNNRGKFQADQIIQCQDGSLIATGNNGLWKSTDGITFTQFASFPNGLSTNFIYKTSESIYVGTLKSLYISRDNGKTFVKNTQLPSNVQINGLGGTTINGKQFIYVLTSHYLSNKKLYYSDNNCTTLTPVRNVITPDSLMVTKVGVFVSHVGDPATGYTYLSTDGVNFNLVYKDSDGQGFYQILATKENILYAYVSNLFDVNIYESKDLGKTWFKNKSLPAAMEIDHTGVSTGLMIQQNNGLVDIALQDKGLWQSASANSDQFKKINLPNRGDAATDDVFQAKNNYIYVGGNKTFWSKDGVNFSLFPNPSFSQNYGFLGFFQGGANNYIYANIDKHTLYVSENGIDFLSINFTTNFFDISTWGLRQKEIIINKYLSNATLFASEKWSDFSAGGGSTEWKCLTDSFHLINKDVYFYANMNYSVLNPPAPSETLAAILAQGITYHFQSVVNPLFHAHKFVGSLNITIKGKLSTVPAKIDN